ncbi:Synaptonemal complex protein 1-like protein [Drosera capensis]
MQKLGFTGLRRFDQYKSRHGAGAARSPSDSITFGGFANLKLTSEKLVREQESVQTDLELANSKLKKSAEHVHTLEEKLRGAFEENTKLKVKGKEDEKLWQGLESKFSLTKTYCDQLNRTLTVLAGQVQDAEKDKLLIQEKLAVNSAALDKLNYQFNHLSLKLQSAEETIRDRDKVIKDLRNEKEEIKSFYRDQDCKSAKLIEEKDASIKCLQADVTASRLTSENLKSNVDDIQQLLKQKEEDLVETRACLQKSESDNVGLHSDKNRLSDKLSMSLQREKSLGDMVNAFAAELTEMEKQSAAVFGKVCRLCSMYDSCSVLVEQEKALEAKRHEQQYGKLHGQFLRVTSERNELISANEGLKDKICELQRTQGSVMVQHAEECHLSEEKIRKLESEVNLLSLKKCEMENLILGFEENVSNLSESLQTSDTKMKDLLQKMSELESENKQNMENLHGEIQSKDGEIDILQKQVGVRKNQVESLEKLVSEIGGALKEKEQLVLQLKEKEKQLEDQKAEIQELLSASDGKLAEAKKHCEAMVESKQAELSRHLKEISLRNDKEMNEIRKKFEVEKQEMVNLEKEKADKMVAAMEKNWEQKLEQCKEESRSHLKNIEEGHRALVTRMKEEQKKKESGIKADHLQELTRIKLQAEEELRERIKMLSNEHEIHIKALKLQHDDECKQLQEELDLQRSKEERQRALLQLQWRVMGDKPQEDQEVNSKKDYSVSSIHVMNADRAVRNKHGPVRRQIEEKESPYLAAVQSPMSALLKQVEKPNPREGMDIPKHSRKVTHHEYEVETTNEGTVTKRRKTKSTVMFGEPRRQRRTATPKAYTPKAYTPKTTVKGTIGTEPKLTSNIGDLFTEGSLNPYADDPYAFD